VALRYGPDVPHERRRVVARVAHDLHGVRSAGKGAKSIPARDRGDRRVAARMDRAQKRKTRRELASR